MTLAMAYVQPHRRPDGHVAGVITAQLTLHDIARFLATVPLSPHGQTFVVDHQGLLVADSRLAAVMDADRRRVAAIRSSDAVIAAAAAHLGGQAGGAGHLDSVYRGGTLIGDQPFFIMASPFDHPTGLRWLIATLAPEADFMAEAARARRDSLLVAAGISAVTLLLGLLLATALTRPVLRLVEHVGRIGGGDLETRLSLRWSPEFNRLSEALNAMTVDLQDRLRLRHSLAVAEAVQRSLLPEQTPTVAGLDIAGTSRYCDQTGGDYYDFLDIRGLAPNTLSLAIGDVVGHGVGAAMLMATARGILHSHCDTKPSLAAMLAHANRHLLPATARDGGRFMTMLLLTLDAAGGRLRWASAGHDLPFVYDPHADRFASLEAGLGLPLGVLEEAEYVENQFSPIRPGQVLLAATDGVWETRSPDGEFFGKDRVRALLRRQATRSAAEIARRLDEELAAFRGQPLPRDDVTCVVVKVERGDGDR